MSNGINGNVDGDRLRVEETGVKSEECFIGELGRSRINLGCNYYNFLS